MRPAAPVRDFDIYRRPVRRTRQAEGGVAGSPMAAGEPAIIPAALFRADAPRPRWTALRETRLGHRAPGEPAPRWADSGSSVIVIPRHQRSSEFAIGIDTRNLDDLVPIRTKSALACQSFEPSHRNSPGSKTETPCDKTFREAPQHRIECFALT